MPERSQDWLRQAEADLRAARDSRESEHFEWAAFASHQAAEKAIKALYQQLHLEAWGHALVKLFEYLPNESRPRSELMDRARELDKHYITTRYPNRFERVVHVEFYKRRRADDASENG